MTQRLSFVLRVFREASMTNVPGPASKMLPD